MTTRRLVAAACALALPVTFSACSNGGDTVADPVLTTQAPADSATSAISSAPAIPSTASPARESSPADSANANAHKEPEYSLVSPEPFMDDAGSNANIAMELAGTPYFCSLGAAAVACSATPDSSVPNLEDMPGTPWGPFTGRPESIFITDDGIMWGIIEGGTPGSGELRPGERLEYLNGWCQVPDEESIQCGYRDESFTISGPNKKVSR